MTSRWSPALGVTGLISSFGCAACCALPIMLAGTGLAGAWTLHLQLLVDPYARWWVWGTIILLGFGAVTWGRALYAHATLDDPRFSLTTHVITPAILIAGVVVVTGTLMVEHASLTDFL